MSSGSSARRTWTRSTCSRSRASTSSSSRTSRTPRTWPTATRASPASRRVHRARTVPASPTSSPGSPRRTGRTRRWSSITPESGSLASGSAASRRPSRCRSSRRSPSGRSRSTRPQRMAELTASRASTSRKAERGPVQVDIPRDYFYGEGEYEITVATAHRARRRRTGVARRRPRGCSPEAQVPGDPVAAAAWSMAERYRRVRGAGRVPAAPGRQLATCTTTRSRPATSSAAGRSATRGRRRR